MNDIILAMQEKAVQELYLILTEEYADIPDGIIRIYNDGLIGEMTYRMWEKYKCPKRKRPMRRKKP